MQADRLTAFGQFFTTAVGSRRAALAATLSGSLGALRFAESRADNAKKRRKKKLKRERRFCRQVANRDQAITRGACTFFYSDRPDLIPACVAAHAPCDRLTRKCKHNAAKACFAAVSDIWISGK